MSGVRYWTKQRILAALARWTEREGRIPTETDWQRAAAEHPCVDTVQDVFGSWNGGLEAAGLPARPAKRAGVRW